MSFEGGELGNESDKEASSGIVGAAVPEETVVVQLRIDQPSSGIGRLSLAGKVGCERQSLARIAFQEGQAPAYFANDFALLRPR